MGESCLPPIINPMSWRYFLYRRLSRWVSFETRLWDDTWLSLRSKYDAASFSDVFCDPFYWQAYGWIDPAPKLVVDCGANCGHFTILAEKCIRARHGTSDTRYVLVEPNPLLMETLSRNLREAGLWDRSVIKQNLLGASGGSAMLWVNPRNFMSSGLTQTAGAKPYSVNFIDLADAVGPSSSIDLMKLDIEGGEYPLVRSNPRFFSRVKTLFLEMHGEDEAQHKELLEGLASAGMTQAVPARKAHGHQLLILTGKGQPPA